MASKPETEIMTDKYEHVVDKNYFFHDYRIFECNCD